MAHHEKDVNDILDFYRGNTELAPTPFEPCFLSTPEFIELWRQYYSKEFLEVEGFRKHLAHAFSTFQVKVKKGRYTHIREVQAFQQYFKTAYRPNDLRRTICEAGVTLKNKFKEKFGSLMKKQASLFCVLMKTTLMICKRKRIKINNMNHLHWINTAQVKLQCKLIIYTFKF